MADYFQTNLYHWDLSAQSAWLSITNANPTNDAFVSYDDQRSCQAKVSYSRSHGLGGVMIWELGQDHQAGVPDPLLQAIKQALATPGWVKLQTSGNDVDLTFTTIALGSYRVQWSSNLTAGVWNSLLVTNISGLGGALQIKDAGAMTNQIDRFYRVLTPP